MLWSVPATWLLVEVHVRKVPLLAEHSIPLRLSYVHSHFCCPPWLAGLRPGKSQAANAALADTYGTLDQNGTYLGPKVDAPMHKNFTSCSFTPFTRTSHQNLCCRRQSLEAPRSCCGNLATTHSPHKFTFFLAHRWRSAVKSPFGCCSIAA